MAAAWSMAVDFSPSRVAIVIDKNTLTRELIDAVSAFSVVIPGCTLVRVTYLVGSELRRDVDNFAHHAIAAAPGPVLGMPVIEDGCSAWMECRRIPERHTEDAYDNCFADIASAATGCSICREGRWVLTADALTLHTSHHLSVLAGSRVPEKC